MAGFYTRLYDSLPKNWKCCSLLLLVPCVLSHSRLVSELKRKIKNYQEIFGRSLECSKLAFHLLLQCDFHILYLTLHFYLMLLMWPLSTLNFFFLLRDQKSFLFLRLMKIKTLWKAIYQLKVCFFNKVFKCIGICICVYRSMYICMDTYTHMHAHIYL